jgi:RNA polymerase sigma factor (sigma-70 family)
MSAGQAGKYTPASRRGRLRALPHESVKLKGQRRPAAARARKDPPLSDLDSSLIRACQAGDARAWEQLIRRYQRLLYAIPLRCGLSEEDAADVFQTVCLRLLENLDRLRNEQHLTGWLITTTKREAWRLCELQRRAPTQKLEAEEELYESLPAPDLLPEEEVLKLEQEQLVRRAMEELGERCRTLLGMLYQTEPPLAYEEIARRLNVSVGAIGPTRARCLEKLRKVLLRMGY